MWALVGLLVLVAGFAVRLNPLLVVALAALVTGVAAGHGLAPTLGALGHAFNEDRYVSLVWLILPLIGLLERYGLQARARAWVVRLQARSAGRLLAVYLLLRQTTAALGLVALGGAAAMVRPMLAPLAESAAERDLGRPLPARTAALVRAHAAAADTIGVFFGEDVFIAFGSVLLIRASLQASGVSVDPVRLSLWALPTAALAFLVHGARLLRLDRRLRRDAERAAEEPA
jgi:uncharacterized membrane protein